MQRNTDYKPPFIYFGGKSAVADIVWGALGDPVNYVEPFAGSAAVLLLRDTPGHIETINDSDGFISNVWRAIKHDPDGVAEHADEIVSECEVHSRHLWLLGQRERLTEKLCGDVEFYDVKAAGYWLYGINCWIGGGWCSGKGPWISRDGVMVKAEDGNGLVCAKRPHLGNPGQGVNRQLPHLGDPGQGVNRRLPHLGDPGKESTRECAARSAWLKEYLGGFADRLRNVRVCCGDWHRVCGPSVTFGHGITGIFLDPPYADTANRTSGIYANDCEQVAHAVREWAIEQGQNPLMRIALCGYSEHEILESHGWSLVEWEATGGYGLISDDEDGVGRTNKKRERIYFSPHCVKAQDDLFSLERSHSAEGVESNE